MSNAGKGGGRGTNQHGLHGRAVQRPGGGVRKRHAEQSYELEPEPTMDDTPYEVLHDDSTQEERREAWEVGAGLQRIDGISPSPVAYSLMDEQVAGRLTYVQVEQKLHRHYMSTPAASSAQREADLAATRIAEIISEPGFTLSAGSLAAIHGRIFDGLLDDRRWEGQFRRETIKKDEPVLGGASVKYTPGQEVARTVTWEFEQERDADFVSHDDFDAITHVVRFTSSVWQIHPFREGNTRATTTFAIKYLRDLGVKIDNEPFLHHSPYFRDALVLDNAPPRLRDRQPLRLFVRVLAGESVQLPDLRAEYPKGTSR